MPKIIHPKCIYFNVTYRIENFYPLIVCKMPQYYIKSDIIDWAWHEKHSIATILKLAYIIINMS